MKFTRCRVSLLLLCALACAFPAKSPSAAEPASLTISNQSSHDLLNIRFRQGRSMHFVRLDMAPGARDDMENPGVTTDLRVDTGLAFWFFKAVPLNQARRLTFCGEHAACLILEQNNKISRHLTGTVQSLLPEESSHPVCSLDQFRPGMTMSEVCSLLNPDSPRDDNDAVLTGLGFAGMVWAARLAPGQTSAAAHRLNGHDRLGHLELRRELNAATLDSLLRALYAQDYAPWQAELPGLDMNFTEMTDLDTAKQKDILRQTLHCFLQSGRGEATVMLAPAAMLPALADADAPQRDVQLFTLTLRQSSRTLMVDVAAYRAGEGR
ncbi:peptidoglycan glycosyltransferase [uncultured Desulfovibrio sp.]|uniref:peptidoglycan glycosyltransferase n=1 Tax=uncultured Desulfovibrio sp. TaxID=167968 RepID=UPI00262BE171|nr:peptidoglycan glycosyltransferase [uncultured Desulfovibrio sp.]